MNYQLQYQLSCDLHDLLALHVIRTLIVNASDLSQYHLSDQSINTIYQYNLQQHILTLPTIPPTSNPLIPSTHFNPPSPHYLLSTHLHHPPYHITGAAETSAQLEKALEGKKLLLLEAEREAAAALEVEKIMQERKKQAEIEAIAAQAIVENHRELAESLLRQKQLLMEEEQQRYKDQTQVPSIEEEEDDEYDDEYEEEEEEDGSSNGSTGIVQ